MSGPPLAVAVFASGGGSTLQRFLDHVATEPLWRVRLVVSDREGVRALERARDAGVEGRVIPTRERTSDDVARETLAALEAAEIEVILLAGYLKLLPAAVVDAFRGRILNIHPALLPAFGGKGMYGVHVHRAVLASGARLSGPTVHFADEVYDHGAILAQWPVPVVEGDTPESLAERVLAREHALYPRVVDHLCAALREGHACGPMPLPPDAWPLPDPS